MPNLPPIEEGDSVSVAGEMESGTLIARAYRDFDNNAHGQWTHRWLVSTIVNAFVFLPVMALYTLFALRGMEINFAILIYLVPFSPFPFHAFSGIAQSMKSNRAARMLPSANECVLDPAL